ncbi:hypothetical protein MNBD_ALPHA07-429 [hydrothermal vent metagenome]|uniref:Glutathione S-transferase n=1 Tax=hydrothermal vent metagenome TaxID=652676 RepID=A0A3B0TG75_9ZZZZ
MLDFFHLNSSCSTAVKAALAVADEPHNLIPVDLGAKTEAFLKANPQGKVPAILTGDAALFEGGAINLWISARNPDAGLMPPLNSTEGAEALKWLFFAYATIHPVWVRLFFPDRFADSSAKESVLAKARDDLFQHYAMINAQVEKTPFIAGEALSLADLYLAATIHWEQALEGKLTEKFPALMQHRDRVIAQPGVKEAFSGEFGYA